MNRGPRAGLRDTHLIKVNMLLGSLAAYSGCVFWQSVVSSDRVDVLLPPSTRTPHPTTATWFVANLKQV